MAVVQDKTGRDRARRVYRADRERQGGMVRGLVRFYEAGYGRVVWGAGVLTRS